MQVFEINEAMGFYSILLALAAGSASIALIAVSPWWFLPVAWFIAGTAFTGVSGSRYALIFKLIYATPIWQVFLFCALELL